MRVCHWAVTLQQECSATECPVTLHIKDFEQVFFDTICTPDNVYSFI